jgi:hypothetical protein
MPGSQSAIGRPLTCHCSDPIDIVPEGRKPRKDAPTSIPAPAHLGVREGAGYASIGGWMETKLGSYRVQDWADVVQVMKVTTPAMLRKFASTWPKRTPFI